MGSSNYQTSDQSAYSVPSTSFKSLSVKHDAHGDRVVPDGQQDLIQVFSLPVSAPSLDYVLQLSMQGLLLITFMFQRLSAHDESVTCRTSLVCPAQPVLCIPIRPTNATVVTSM